MAPVRGSTTCVLNAGWLGFVILAVLIGQMAGQKTIFGADQFNGEAGRAEHTLEDAGLRPNDEVVLVQSKSLTTADPELLKLYAELKAYPMPARAGPLSSDNVAIPFKLRLGGEVLSFISTTMIFGTPVDVTLSELALETFFPADDLTARRMRETAAKLT